MRNRFANRLESCQERQDAGHDADTPPNLPLSRTSASPPLTMPDAHIQTASHCHAISPAWKCASTNTNLFYASMLQWYHLCSRAVGAQASFLRPHTYASWPLVKRSIFSPIREKKMLCIEKIRPASAKQSETSIVSQQNEEIPKRKCASHGLQTRCEDMQTREYEVRTGVP